MPILRPTALALALAAGIAAAGSVAAQSPEPAPPVPVEQQAPKGSSGGDIAMGAAVGLVGGLLVLALIVGSG